MTLILSNKQLFRYLFVILLIGVILGSISLVYPFGRDQGIYAYIGKLINEGKIDYKYSYNLRPPGVHYVFAFSQMILGKSMMSMRVFDIFWQAITAFIIFLVTLELSKKKLISLVPSVLYIYLYYRLNYWHTLQTDGFMVLPFAVCILLLIKFGINNSGLNLFLSGCFFSITIFFKFTVIIFLPLLFI
ncbi:MAG: glycosyltransferase family 39 protein, partial [Ignavibacteria bacterium]